MEIYVATSNVLGLYHNSTATRPDGLLIGILDTPFVISQSVVANANPKNLFASNTITFSQVAQTPIHLSVSDYLELSQQAAKTIPLFASNPLQLMQEAESVSFQPISQVLALSHDVQVSYGFSSQLVISQSLALTRIANTNPTQVLILYHAASVYVEDNVDDTLIPITPFPPSFQPVELSFGSLILTLKIPEFDNSHSIELSRVNRNSRGGDLIIFRDPQWPSTEILKFNFNNLTQAQAKGYLDFLINTLGQEITLVDHEGIEWVGIVLNPEADVTQETRGNGSCGGFNTELQFQGVKV